MLNWIIGGVFVITVIVLLCKIHNRNETIERLEKKHKEFRERCKVLISDIEHTYGEDFLIKVAGVPGNDFLDGEGLPHSPDEKEKYVVWVASFHDFRQPSKIHSKDCQHGKWSANIYNLRQKRLVVEEPCFFCKYTPPKTWWVGKYKNLLSIVNEIMGRSDDDKVMQKRCQKYMDSIVTTPRPKEHSMVADDNIRIHPRRRTNNLY